MLIKIGKYIALTLAVIMAVSCADDNVGDMAPSQAKMYHAGFTVTVASDSGRASRAPSEGEYEPGSADENFIDIDGEDFKVLIFDEENTYIATLENIIITPENLGTLKRYHVSGTVLAAAIDAVDRTFKVVMLANWGQENYPAPVAGQTKLGEIAASDCSVFQFDYDTDQDIVRKPIPMFGVTNLLKDLKFFDGFNTDLGNLHMLRAYAKIRIKIVEEDYKAENVKLTLGNPSGFRAPKGVTLQDQYVQGSYAKDYYRVPTVPSASTTVRRQDIPFKKGSDGFWTLYVPEFQNLNSSGQALSEGDRARIKIEFANAAPAYIDFKYYNQPPSYAGDDVKLGDHFDLLRNTVYEFTVSKGAVFVDVQPYSLVELKPDFGLERDPDGNIVVRDENGDIVKIIELSGQELHLEDFKMYDLEGTGVYDENDNVQLVYLDDGRLMVFNYQTGKFLTDQAADATAVEINVPVMIRWELYSYESMVGAKNLVRTMFLMEEFEIYRYDWALGEFWPVNLHNVYDDGSTVIQRHTYASKEAFDRGDNPLSTSIDFRCTDTKYSPSYGYSDKIVRYYNHGDLIRQTRINKEYEQGVNDYNDDAYEIDHYEMDDEGNYLTDEHGRRIPVYKTDENGNLIPIMVNNYYFEELDLNATLFDNEIFTDWPY